MKCTPEEVIQYVEEEDVQFVRLAFCDIFGNEKNVAIMPTELRRAFECGIAVDASAIAGFGGEVRSDIFLHPDPTTLSQLPWRPESGNVIRLFCDISYPDGTPFEFDGRGILKRAVAAAQDAGISFAFGSEMEFYLCKTDENGNATLIPYDNAGYMDIAPDDKGETIRREICMTLEHLGIQPESAHHEEGPGQNEIDFRYSDPLSAADNAITFRGVVKTVAMRNGLVANFDPKPMPKCAGSGLHINISVKDANGTEDLLPNLIAGIMEKISDMTLFLNPCKNSYERLGSSKAPGYITWSSENRSQLIRIPAADPEHHRAELRSPDPSANPYLAYTLLIYAGLYGIQNRLLPPEAADFNLFTASPERLDAYRRLPASLPEAQDAARDSAFVHDILPAAVVAAYLNKER